MDLSQIAKKIRVIADSIPGVVTGTVAGASGDGKMLVILDSDPARGSVSAISLVGTQPVTGARVLCLRYAPSGLVVLGFLALPTPTIVQQFYIPGTWTKPEGLRGVWVELQAAGGGSGGISATTAADTSSSGGGQGGGYAKFWVPAADLPASVAVGVGLGGNAGAAGNNPGGDGTASSFGSFGSIPGGEGGAGGGVAAFAGAATTQNGGDNNQIFTGSALNPLVITGSAGGTGFRIGGSPTAIPGYGGGSAQAGQQRVQQLGAGLPGQILPISGYFAGGGAAGGANIATIRAAIGGALGADGFVYVTEIYY